MNTFIRIMGVAGLVCLLLVSSVFGTSNKSSSPTSIGTPTNTVLIATDGVTPRAKAPLVQIGLMEGQVSVPLYGDTGLTVYRAIGTKWKSFTNKDVLHITYKDNSVYINNQKADTAVSIFPSNPSAGVKVYNGYYRGWLQIMGSPRQAGFTVVNLVPVDDYLYGVVGKEMSPSWNEEALKAQAVAARTYAINHKGYFAARGFDMTDDTNSQVYGGISAESAIVTKVVDSTRGEIITYGGKPIDAFFSATAGGYTENSEDVWGTKIPYLRGVTDASDRMPSYSWQVKTTWQQVEKNLTAAGKGVGTLRSVRLSPLNKRPMAVTDRGVSGRVRYIQFEGTKGMVQVSGNDFQRIFGLRSTLFDFYDNANIPQNIDKIVNKRTDVIKVNNAVTVAAKGGRSGKTILAQPPAIYIGGYGWGHGLGMSQWGAQQMSMDNKNYKDILLHYYTGTKIEKIY